MVEGGELACWVEGGKDNLGGEVGGRPVAKL